MFNLPQKKNTELKRNYLGKNSLRQRNVQSVGKSKYRTLFQISGWLFALLSCFAAWIVVPEIRLMITEIRLMVMDGANQGSAGLAYQITPTITPTFVMPLISNTPIGVVLKPGEKWTKDNIQLLLAHTNVSNGASLPCMFGIEFQMVNLSAEDAQISINKSDFVLLDNNGREWSNLGIGTHDLCPTNGAPAILIENLSAGGGKISWIIWYSENFESLDVSELVLTASNVLDGVIATWSIQLE